MFTVILFLPLWSGAQPEIPDSFFQEKYAEWKVLLKISDKPFSREELDQWKYISGQPVAVYRNAAAEFRAVVDAPAYWVRSTAYQDSLIAAGIPDAGLVRLYAGRYSRQYWSKKIDFGERIDPCGSK